MKRYILILLTLVSSFSFAALKADEIPADIIYTDGEGSFGRVIEPEFEIDGISYCKITLDYYTSTYGVCVVAPVKLDVFWAVSSADAPFYAPEEMVSDAISKFPEDGYYSGEIVIPESVEFEGSTYPVYGVGPYAFMNCKNLTSVKLPESIKEIFMGAFVNCEKIEEFMSPNSLKYIWYNVFDGCTGIKSINFNDVSGFMSNLNSLKIESLTLTKSQVVFWRIDLPASLNDITIPYSDPAYHKNGMYQVSDPILFEQATVYVPQGCEEAFRNDSFWGQFKNIKGSTSGLNDVAKASDVLRVDGSVIALQGDMTVEVYSTLGIRVATLSAANPSASLPAGIYICSAPGFCSKVIIR